MTIHFEVIDTNTIKRTDAEGNETFIPADLRNGMYQRYLHWLETGNELVQAAP